MPGCECLSVDLALSCCSNSLMFINILPNKINLIIYFFYCFLFCSGDSMDVHKADVGY